MILAADTNVPLLDAIFAAACGACLGSFANVLVYRLPRNLSCVHPRSFCPRCERQLTWYENVPVLSWLLLRGRCRRCGAAISWRYPAVEVAAAVCGVLAWWRFGMSPAGLGALIFMVNLLAVALIDWEHMIIPHTLTLGGMSAGLALSPWNGLGLDASLLGGLAGAGAIVALAYGYRLVRGRIGMGGGDVMLMGMVGIFLGVTGVGLVLFGGALLGSLYAVIRYRGAVTGQSKLPFGTFLAAAAVLVLFVGQDAVRWYWGLMA